MGVNLFQKLYDECNWGDMKAKLKTPFNFPCVVDLELTNLCNLKCSMCPTGRGVLTRPKGLMSWDMYMSVIDQLPQGTGVRFARWGEPLLHADCLRMVKYAKAKKMLVHTHTNGMFLDSDFVDRICSIPLDSIKFSFQGVTADQYNRIREKADFNLLLGAIKELHRVRGGRKFPYIQIATTVLPDTPTEEIEQFQKSVGSICDQVDVGQTRNLFVPDEETNFPNCPEVFDKLSINWDGTVVACCGDWNNELYLGDLKTQTIKQVWNGNRLRELREMLAAKRHNELPLCRHCRL
jgi:radical SAM protein with 4Fe4S-binding SPASM domain